MGKIIDLPNELLEAIFDYAIPEPAPPPRTPDINLDDPSRATFPFNVASTCTSLLEVLKANQKYWRYVVIDLADDPTGFLDTFSLFEVKHNVYQPGITVTIFSSDTEDPKRFEISGMPTRISQRSAENSRARVVFQHLERSLARCASITIQLVYQSSLPSMSLFLTRANPLLRNLTITSLIHDEQLHEPVKLPPLPHTQFIVFTMVLPRLSNISLTGKCFMDLCLSSPEWVVLLRPPPVSRVFQITINHFRFDNEREVQGFYDALASLCPIHTLTLSDLTLGYTPTDPISRSDSDSQFLAAHVFLDSVSSQFLSVFLPRMMENPNIVVISLRNTSVPFINRLNTSTAFRPIVPLLQLIDIHSGVQDDGLYNSVATFDAEHVHFLRCEGVTDNFLSRLSGASNTEIANAQALELHDCSGFTSRGLRAFIVERQRMHSEDPTEYKKLQAVDVHGSGPLLSVGDAAWFLDAELNSTRVEWNVEPTRAAQAGYITDLRLSHDTRDILEYAIGGWCVGNSSKNTIYALSWWDTPGFMLFD